MADEARPLSRREKREMEERVEAGGGPVPADSSAPAAWKNPVVEAVDASGGLSRRDRRRIERLEQPMETWTAVEEMRHTGQVPTMTPEVIAQQEELARRRAAEAQADAVRATGETAHVGADEVAPGAISRFDMPDGAPRAPVAGDEARRRLAQAAAAAAAALPADRERPPAPAQVKQEFGILDAPRPPTSELPALAALTPLAGVPSAQAPHPSAAPQAQAQAQAMAQAQAQAMAQAQAQGLYLEGGLPVPPQQGVPGQGPHLPPSGAVPTMAPPGSPPVYAPGAPQGAPGAQPAVVGQVIPGAPQGAPGSPTPPGFGPPTGAVPTQGAQSPYQPGTALSPIATGALRPVPGATGTMRAIQAGPMTGTIPRPIVEVQPAGGARDFGWAHIAVLGAVAFVLGLVVWQISGLGG